MKRAIVHRLKPRRSAVAWPAAQTVDTVPPFTSQQPRPQIRRRNVPPKMSEG
jgi:hypothetical protein